MYNRNAMPEPVYAPLNFVEYPLEEMQARSEAFRDELRRRRSVRHFSNRPVPREIIANCLQAAATAPSGANQQPWHFVVVSDPVIRSQIRAAAEAEERAFYTRRATPEWLAALAPLGTDAEKPFLERAPYLIAIFAQVNGLSAQGERVKHYYVSESVGLATGLLIAALHHAGLATLTHTPSPMGFLSRILGRPVNEKPFLLLVTGYPEDGALVPAISKKPFDDIATFLE
jgi:iodotyrosine deiodinase